MSHKQAKRLAYRTALRFERDGFKPTYLPTVGATGEAPTLRQAYQAEKRNRPEPGPIYRCYVSSWTNVSHRTKP